jgi:hypothetical protein
LEPDQCYLDLSVVPLQVLNSRSPAARYVITPNWLWNWVAPTLFPPRLVDKEMTRMFRLQKCARCYAHPWHACVPMQG